METIALAPNSASSLSPESARKPSISEIKSFSPPNRSYGCDHLREYLEDSQIDGIKQYSQLVQAIRKDNNLATHLPKTINSGVYSLRPLWLCLQCSNIATTETRQAHDANHRFCAESTSAYLYCRACADIIYDSTMEDIRLMRGRKRSYNNFISEPDTRVLSTNSFPTPCRAVGLRGLYNMGQTCFMSVVLQSLVHNPFIRSYYLGENHRSGECDKECCTSCALDDIFTEFHSTEKAEGYGMVAMLQASWRGGKSLAGYQQQDAHEYLQFILNSLHSANVDPDADEEQAEECPCIIHKTFCGVLQSTVTCSKCKNVTTAKDAFMDLSLEVKQSVPKKKDNKISMTSGNKKDKEKDKHDKENDSGKDKDKSTINLATSAPSSASVMALTDCLDRFTSIEVLPATEYTCRRCDAPQAATKRLSISRLPPVLPIHLKRFSHSKNSSVKLDVHVKFPLTIDLSPYFRTPLNLTSGGKKADKAIMIGVEYVERAIYELSSVVVHKGKMDSGHYISFSRVNDEWFMFDDSKVVIVDESEVLASEAYMLFYIVKQVVV